MVLARRTSLGLIIAALLGCGPVIGTTVTHPPRRPIELDALDLDACRLLAGEVVGELHDEQMPGPMPAIELPPEIRRVATLAGVVPTLAALEAGEGDRLALELRLVMRLSAIEIQVSSLVSEAQCVGAQIDAMLVELEARQDRYEIGMTVSSILVGALVSAGGGIWELRTESDQPAILLIAGGVVSAGIGLAAFVPERRPVVFEHERNLLAPMASGEDPEHVYPAFVLAFVEAPDAEGRTLREDILDDWDEVIEDAYPPEQRALAREVLFGTGGLYDAKLLEVREALLDVFETHIDGINQELELLYRYSARIIDARPPASPAAAQ